MSTLPRFRLGEPLRHVPTERRFAPFTPALLVGFEQLSGCRFRTTFLNTELRQEVAKRVRVRALLAGRILDATRLD